MNTHNHEGGATSQSQRLAACWWFCHFPYSLGFLRGVHPPSCLPPRPVLPVPGGNFTLGMSGRRGVAGLSAREAAGAAPPSGHVPALQGNEWPVGLKREKSVPRLCFFPASFFLCAETQWAGLVRAMPDSTKSATRRFVLATFHIACINGFFCVCLIRLLLKYFFYFIWL